jgi:very-short-patch-repair endonuclease
VQQDEIDGLPIEQIRIASRSERHQGRHPPPFDSWFEVDVFLRIVDRGYRVIPQYHVNPFDRSFRIDMVVEGVHGRLAVECDGDQWHGPDRYDEDMARQRELERAGWRFWRVRGGAFYYEPDGAMKTLWESLEHHGIFPHGQEAVDGLFSEEISPIDESADIVLNVEAAATDDTSTSSSSLSKIEASDNTRRSQEAKRREFSAKELQTAIISVLENKPNNSIATKSLTQAVCRQLEILTRGAPRLELDKRIRRSVGVLKRRGIVKEYKAKNVRIKLQQFDMHVV